MEQQHLPASFAHTDPRQRTPSDVHSRA